MLHGLAKKQMLPKGRDQGLSKNWSKAWTVLEWRRRGMGPCPQHGEEARLEAVGALGRGTTVCVCERVCVCCVVKACKVCTLNGPGDVCGCVSAVYGM